jgi:KaiC/GvpD/RAD55 family RecA-like ATPase
MTVILAGTNVGKTLMMCHFAAAFYLQHLNVLYITLEMSEKKIGRRIDANLLDVNMNDLKLLSKESYDKKIARVKAKTKGKLIIREFPTASASTIHFRALMNELYLKKQFKPDVVFVDYLAICASARLKPGVAGMYAYVKAISEELRGFATEFKVPLFTGAQSNRVGYLDSDPGLEHTAESFGLPATADLMFVVTSNDVLAAANQLMVKQLKNRDEDVNKNRKFVIGVDRNKMRLYDVVESEQTLVDAGQAESDAPKSQGKWDKYKLD